MSWATMNDFCKVETKHNHSNISLKQRQTFLLPHVPFQAKLIAMLSTISQPSIMSFHIREQ